MGLKICVLIAMFCISALSQSYEDKRCRCVCPNPAAVLKNTEMSDRRLYIAYVAPSQCNCDGVIIPRVTDDIKEQAQIFCPRCECKYESRNSTVIMIVVMLVIWVLTLLCAYLVFVVLLSPLRNKRRTRSYQARNTEETVNLLQAEEANTEL